MKNIFNKLHEDMMSGTQDDNYKLEEKQADKNLRLSVGQIGDVEELKDLGYSIEWDYSKEQMIISDGNDTWYLKQV